MADVVQIRMERMTDELDDLERRGLFTRPEISEIVRRRRDFEYRLKRPQPLKQDFLDYVEYERHVDALRNLRKRKIIGERRRRREKSGEAAEETKGRSRGKKWKNSVSDFAGVRRILDVYRLATVRYKGDLDLWFRYLEFCRESGHGRLKQILARAIRFHPNVPGLWIYAASWEFDQNLNVAAARALMQEGIRSCPKSEDLWIEYIRMELTYLNKLKARKIFLGEDVKPVERDSGESKQWKEENKDLFMPLNGGEKEAEESTQGESEKRDLIWQHGSKILQTVYHGAVEAIPSSLSLRKQFLEILNTVGLAHSDKLKAEIMEDLKKHFSHDEYYWDWIARLQISDTRQSNNLQNTEILSKLNKAVEVYEEALSIIPSTKMFSLYAKFWLDMIVPESEHSDTVFSKTGIDSTDFTSSILKVYEKAESNGFLTEDLAYQYVSFYLETGRVDEARNLAKKFCNGVLSGSAKLWTLMASIEMKWLANKSASMSKDEMEFVFKLIRDVLTRSSILDAEGLWLMAIKFFSNKKSYFEKLVKVSLKVLAKAGGSYSGYTISSAIVNWLLQRDDGIQCARKMYKRFLDLPHPSLGFYKHCIELESNLAFIGDGDGVANARKLYESALRLYGQNRELWKDYYTLEMKVGTSATAHAVYWRARKELKDTTGLSLPGDL